MKQQVIKDRALLNTKEACRFLSISKTTLYSIANKGKLNKIRVGGSTRWQVSELERIALHGA